VAVGDFDGLVKIGKNVAEVFNADREADEFGGGSGRALLFDGELLVSGRGGVDHQRLSVADIGQQGEKLEGVDELCRLRIRRGCRR